MQTLILKRPLLMAVFGLASMQQITYHMKVLHVVLPLQENTDSPWRPSREMVVVVREKRIEQRDPMAHQEPGYSDRPVVLSPGEGKSMGEVLKSGDPLHPKVLIRISIEKCNSV
jgi:hypothetical protein